MVDGIGSSPKEVEQQAKAVRARRALEAIEPYLDSERKASVRQLFDDLRLGKTIDPQAAVQAVLRLYELSRMEQVLLRQIEASAPKVSGPVQDLV